MTATFTVSLSKFMHSVCYISYIKLSQNIFLTFTVQDQTSKICFRVLLVANSFVRVKLFVNLLGCSSNLRIYLIWCETVAFPNELPLLTGLVQLNSKAAACMYPPFRQLAGFGWLTYQFLLVAPWWANHFCCVPRFHYYNRSQVANFTGMSSPCITLSSDT